MDFLNNIGSELSQKNIPEYYIQNVLYFCKHYILAARIGGLSDQNIQEMLLCLFDLLKKQIDQPFEFEPFHQKITAPFNYYDFGNHFISAVIDKKNSKVLGKNNLKQINNYVNAGENVIFFANHQIEADPQIISILLCDDYKDLAENFISVAGERVLKDHLAAPFSMGRNLLCIYSKKHIESPIQLKEEKIKYNKRTMSLMKALLAEGGKAIYVAPSGGRDRKNENGVISLAPFNAQSIAMFHLIAQSSKTPCHFFPLALFSYDILPPPKSVGGVLGEKRSACFCPAHLHFGEEIDFSTLIKDKNLSKQGLKQIQADAIYQVVLQNYKKLEAINS